MVNRAERRGESDDEEENDQEQETQELVRDFS
jgi:hypothetical protein